VTSGAFLSAQGGMNKGISVVQTGTPGAAYNSELAELPKSIQRIYAGDPSRLHIQVM
jgi:hypothetical protein